MLEIDEDTTGNYVSCSVALCVKRNCLESSYVKNGVIMLICGVIALPRNSIAVPATNIGDHLGSLLECADGSDVSFVVGGETFRAHRAVLAVRSSVFRAELFGSLAEATMQCITLNDIEPSTFRQRPHSFSVCLQQRTGTTSAD